MKLIKAFVLVAVASLSCASLAASKKGSSIGRAISLKASQSARLVAEYDPEEKEYDTESGVAYYSVTLKRGNAYTIWITGGDAEDIDFDVDINEEEYDKSKYEKEDKYGNDKYPIPGASFDIVSIDGGNTQVAYLYADDWDSEEDPKSGKYIVMLSGSVNQTTTLGYTTGIKNFTMVGSAESPKAVSFSKKWKTYSGKLIDGEFHFSASLKAGQKYRVRTQGGKKTAPLELDVDDGLGNAEDAESEEEQDAAEQPDADYASDVNNAAYVIVPSKSGKYTFVVSGDAAQSFSFKYQMLPKRAINLHPYIPLLPERHFTAKFVPGRKANNNSYYDDIIDEHLCRIYLQKGERWVFETTNASRDQEMIAYDSTGKVLVSNMTADNKGYDTRVVITASTSGLYYVGVCDPTLDVKDTADASEITLTARNVTELTLPDDYDPVDDGYAGATPLTAIPCTTNVTSVTDFIATNGTSAMAIGATSDIHRLGANDIYDYFAIPCRAGCTYSLRATFADENDTSALTLAATAFSFVDGKSKTASILANTSISPVTLENVSDDFTFTAKTSGTYYIRVWVAEGKGLDFPGYRMNAVVKNGEKDFGLLKVVTEGGVGAWYLNKESSITYAGGLTLAMVTNASVTVNFVSVNGYIAPDSARVAIPKWDRDATMPCDEPITVTVRYKDEYDSRYAMSSKKVIDKKTKKQFTQYTYSPAYGDDAPDGAFPITPAVTLKTCTRTLWEDDPADNFSFTAVEGVFYNFTVAGATNVTLVVSNATSGAVWTGTPLADGTGAELTRQLLQAGKTYVTIAHGDGQEKNAVYSFTYSKAAPGIVRFTNAKGAVTTSFAVNEGAGYASLYVSRTGKEGVTRVRYATQAVTAQPGVNYYPVTDGEVVWNAGDKTAKEIRISMIQDLNAHWAPSNLTFSVKLFPVDECELSDGEYLACLAATDTASVTIKEKTAKKPGTLSLTAYGNGVDSPTAVQNVKKPSVVGVAGNDTFTLTFSRQGGADGKVSVKVATSTAKKDTAKAGIDYVAKTEILTWEDGDTEDKTFVLDLKAVSGYAVSKNFTLTMTEVKTDSKPTLSAKTAVVTVKNATVDQLAAAYVKTLASPGLALASTGTWFKDYDGRLRSAAKAGTLTYTLTGPGFFLCKPSVVTNSELDAATLTCQFDRESPIDCTVRGSEDSIARVIVSGKHSVKFTISGVQGDAYAAFENEASGKPYLWVPLSDIIPDDPMNKAFVTNQANLAWMLPADLSGRSGFWNRVRFGTNTKSMSVLGYVPAKDVGKIAVPPGLLEAGKTYYWAVDSVYTNAVSLADEDLSELNYALGATWSFNIVQDGAPITAFRSGVVDATGESVADRFAAGEPVELIQGVKVSLGLEGESEGEGDTEMANYFRFVGGTLPKGLSVGATAGFITGVPTTPGEYRALVQSVIRTGKTVTKNKKKTTTYSYVYGTTMPVTFLVMPAGTSIGSFRAWLEESGSRFQQDPRRNGMLALSSTSAGKITASVTIGGVAYKFTGTGYDEILRSDETPPGMAHTFQVKLTNTTLINKKTKTYNYLTIIMNDGPVANSVALAQSMGEVSLEMNVATADKKSYTPDVKYRGFLYRNNGTSELGRAAMADFDGYYTVSLPPTNVNASDGVPFGNGYLLMTVAAGSIKVTGVMADGTAISCSTFGQLLGQDLADARACTLSVPIFAGKNTAYSLGGVLQIAYENPDKAESRPVVMPSAPLSWAKPKAAATSREGYGFNIIVAPTGGWYDKTVNLQAYYRDRDFVVRSVESSDDLPEEALTGNYKFSEVGGPADLKATPQDLSVRLVGNAFSVPARKLVKNKTTSLYDFTSSVNPWAVTVKYNRATGVVTGTLSAWEWIFRDVGGFIYATGQKQISKLTHKGVLLFSRDSSAVSPLHPDSLTSGFFIIPPSNTKKVKWRASLPFGIYSEDDSEKSWEELLFDGLDNDDN